MRILRESGYEKPQHVINNIRKYLEFENSISLYANSKKGKYVISDPEKLQSLISKYESGEKIESENNISIQHEVGVYSYYDKKQIVVDLNNPNDEHSFLHTYCKDKKAGERFSVQSKEYVVVNFKKNQTTG